MSASTQAVAGRGQRTHKPTPGHPITPAGLVEQRSTPASMDELRSLILESDLTNPSMQRFLDSPHMTTAVILEGHHAFIKTGMAYEVLRQELNHGPFSLGDFYRHMHREFGLTIEEVEDAITCSRIARAVLSKEPKLGLREPIVSTTLLITDKYTERDEGVREAAGLLLQVAAQNHGEITSRQVSKAVGQWLLNRAA